MIVPTVGRVVWFRPDENDHRVAMATRGLEQPLAAIVTYVFGDREVNLAVFDHDGNSYARTRVQLLQEGDEIPVGSRYAQWMPFQVGQAKKHEQLDKALANGSTGVTEQAPGAASPRPAGVSRAGVAAIARFCHEVNRAYCQSQGDLSQPAWNDAPDWQRASAITGVEFAIAHPDAKPSDSHKSWLAEKIADGWKFGPEKDPEKKEHPCMVAYDELPAAQKAKDYIFLAVVRTAMLPA